jgi:hypothetical protein
MKCFMEELLIFNIHVYVFLYCHLFDNIFFCKYYINIILQKMLAYCDELQWSKADRTDVDVVSFVFVFLLMVPCQ